MLKETLCQIGLTNNEAKIYIALVSLGPQPANVIARKSGVKRTTAYPILKNLQKKSLISSFIKGGIRYFAVSDLNNLLEYVERKKRLIDHHREFVIDILPKMERMKSNLLTPPKVHYFEGVDGIKTVLNYSLKSKGPILSITAMEKWLNSDLLDFVDWYENTRLFDKKIPSRSLERDTHLARTFLGKYYAEADPKLMEIRLIKGRNQLFDNVVNIYDDKVAIMSPDRGFEFAVLIESEKFASTQRSIFELAWKGALVHNDEVKLNRSREN